MHVAFLTDVALPYVSGVTLAVRRQRDALRERGHAVTVAGPHGDVDLAEPDVQVPGAPPGYRVALFGPRLGARLRERGVEVLHAHSVFGASGAAVSIARARPRLPFVVTLHTRLDEYVHYARIAAPLAKLLVDPYVGAVLASADAVVAPSRELAAEIAAAAAAVPVHVVPAPTDPALARGDRGRGRARAAVAPDAPLLLSASRLAAEKRVLDLVDALAALPGSGAVLAFAGDGPLRGALAERAAALGVADRMRFLGQLDASALADAFAAADVVVSASRSETQGLALCESAAAGRAIVAPRRGGYAEVLEDGRGGLFPGAAPAVAELAGAIGRVLADPALRARLGAEACRRASIAWSPEAVARGLAAAYEDARRMRE